MTPPTNRNVHPDWKRLLDHLIEYEGLREEAYPDPARGWKLPTIGVGCTRYHSGEKVKRGDKITRQQAIDECLLHLEHQVFPALERLLPGVKLTAGQRQGLGSFVLNVGSGRFGSSTMRRKILAGDMAGAADEFGKWRKSGGKVMKGLIKRREAERALFLS